MSAYNDSLLRPSVVPATRIHHAYFYKSRSHGGVFSVSGDVLRVFVLVGLATTIFVHEPNYIRSWHRLQTKAIQAAILD